MSETQPQQPERPSPPGEESPHRVPPNILFILMDNLGYGELGCYGGGVLRGAPTPTIDKLASEGLRLTNFNVESQCTPSRSAIMTGRHSIRSGTHSVPFGGTFDGLTQWEVTIAEVLSLAKYATGHFGKWHLGSTEGRFPNNQGFHLWYGIPRTTDEAFWPDNEAARAAGIHFEHTMEGEAGGQSRELKLYDLHERRLIDEECTRRAIEFMQASHARRQPFYAYVPFTQVHLPTLPHPEFTGRTGHGDFPDCLAEMDHRVGELLGAIDEMGIADNTIVIFTSDNGPDPSWPWHGSSGPWTGYYFTHMEGSNRVPFIIRWPGKIEPGRTSNEIMHEVDTYTTLAALAGAGAHVPTDRAVDGLDQSAFLLGQGPSARESFPCFCADRLEAFVWQNWKLRLYAPARDWNTPPIKLGIPQLVNLLTDPKEEHGTLDSIRNTWVTVPLGKRVAEFFATFKSDPPIAPGTPDPHEPQAAGAGYAVPMPSMATID